LKSGKWVHVLPHSKLAGASLFLPDYMPDNVRQIGGVATTKTQKPEPGKSLARVVRHHVTGTNVHHLFE